MRFCFITRLDCSLGIYLCCWSAICFENVIFTALRVVGGVCVASIGGQHHWTSNPIVPRSRPPQITSTIPVLGNPKFNFSGLLAKNELVASCKLGAFNNGYVSLSLDHLACRNCFEWGTRKLARTKRNISTIYKDKYYLFAFICNSFDII